LTVTKSGFGTGRVTSAPAGIDCGATCSASYSSGTNITVTATPDPGSDFTSFTGSCTPSNMTCALTLSASTTVNADFRQGQQLTIAKTGNGRIVSSPAGIDCGSSCQNPFTNGTNINLTANADPGWTFIGFSGGCTSSST